VPLLSELVPLVVPLFENSAAIICSDKGLAMPPGMGGASCALLELLVELELALLVPLSAPHPPQ
jgi:hypothetical protein